MKRNMETGRGAMIGRLRRGTRHTTGNAAIEAALLAPMLVLLAVAIADYGLSIQRQMQIQHAAQAGADYAMRSGFNAAAIANAVTGATTAPGVSASPVPAETCGCTAGTTIVAAACTALCADGTAAGRYVTVSAQGTYSTLMPYPGIPTSFTFNATAITRTR
jgi:Flp pilus assembly protein TadG